MKTLSYILVSISMLCCFFANPLSRAELPSSDAQIRKVISLLMSTEASDVVVKQEIENLGQLYDDHPNEYVYVMNRTVNVLFQENRKNGGKWNELIDALSKKILAKDTTSYQSQGLQIEVIVYYMTLNTGDTPALISSNRKERAAELVTIWQCVSEGIDPDWDPYDPKNALPPYFPSPTLVEAWDSGQSPDSIKDPEVREKVRAEYEEHRKKQVAFSKKRMDQKEAKDVIRRYGDKVKEYLVNSYSIQPFATAELEALLKEHLVDEAFAKEILDAVKNAEKNADAPKTEAKPE